MLSIPTPVEVSLESLVVEVVDEFRDRWQRGERPTVEEYVARYPQAGALLRNVLATLELLELSLHGGKTLSAGEPVPAGQPLGDFRIVGEVGRGGMGIVYEAEQISLGRRVALKTLPFAALMDPRHLQRFQNEARAAASLLHPHIVPVFAVGCERGVHYYAMQFIEGQSLAQFIAQLRQAPAENGSPVRPDLPAKVPAARAPSSPEKLSSQSVAAVETPLPGPTKASGTSPPQDRGYFRRVAEWGIQAAEALEYAHSLGVVHRDIKPGNLLLDHRGQVWVTDFGLARVGSEPNLTFSGDIVGTLRYMSPEQALARHGLVDHHTDIYALGATLYELLTLEPAVGGQDRQEILRKIELEDSVPLRKNNRAIPVDLETIILKAMAKEPGQRYPTAQALADDLRRWREDRPIVARRPSWPKRLGYWGRRHPRGVAVGFTLLFLALVGGVLALVWWQHQEFLRETREAALVGAVEEDLDQVLDFLLRENWPETWTVLKRAEERLGGQGPDNLAEKVNQRRKEVEMVAHLEKAKLARCLLLEVEMPGLDFIASDRAYGAAFGAFDLDMAHLSLEEVVSRIRSSPIQEKLVAAFDDWAFCRDQIEVLPDSETVNPHVGLDLWARLRYIVNAERGDRLRRISREVDRNPWREKLREAGQQKDLEALRGLAEVEETPHQPVAYLCLLAEFLRIGGDWEKATRVLERGYLAQPGNFWVNFNLGMILGEHGGQQDSLGFFRAALALHPENPAVNLWLAQAFRTRGRDNDLAHYNHFYRKYMSLRSGSESEVTNFISFCPKGQRLFGTRSLSWNQDKPGEIKMWELPTGRELHSFKGPSGALISLSVSPDGKFLAGGSNVNTAKIWDIETGREIFTLNSYRPNWCTCLCFSPDSKRLACSYTTVGYNPSGIKVLDLATAKELLDLKGVSLGSDKMAFSPDGKYLAGWDQQLNIGIWNSWTGRPVHILGTHRNHLAWTMCFSPDGKFLASGSFDGTVKIWDPATGMEKQTLYGHTNKVIDVSFTPDSKYLASASDDWTVKIWEVATGREVRTLIGHVNSVCHTDFSPDGNYLASCAGDQMVKVWDLQTGKEVLSLPKGLARSAGRLGAPGEEVSVGHDARARTLLREKKWWEAEAASRKALAEQLDFAPAWQHLGFAYLGQGKLKGAVEAFRQAIRLQSKEALSYYGLGLALFELNRPGPATAVLLSLQGLANQGKSPEAARVWGEALALIRDDARLQNSIAWFLVATRDLAHRQPPEAVRLAQRAVQLAPKEGVYLNTLGVAHYRNGNLEKAIEVLTWSMELRQGGDPKDWFFLAMAHQQLKDPEQARKWYDKAVKWMDEKKTTNEDLRGFREEAEEILGKKAVRELLPPPRLEP